MPYKPQRATGREIEPEPKYLSGMPTTGTGNIRGNVQPEDDTDPGDSYMYEAMLRGPILHQPLTALFLVPLLAMPCLVSLWQSALQARLVPLAIEEPAAPDL